ncbi:hypothetical protein HMPREF1529_01622 [Microbacterium sp. oral taxon 186 str. F0373]|uniref:hypothetical protein n=1 Tax=Microbacterium sp. oral taxon 186 TaxID=712383 RepID=UPI00034E6356|nr:hypothetical protein [Microbacterium sp. oral taxon 186]EPD85012.1 hypothetical protein HMPREF1529_01622 [Microbacterium sp. oral taxon 186 str. F0373]
MAATAVPLVESSTLPGVVLVERVRRLILLSVLLACGYGMFVRGQKQSCIGQPSGPAACTELIMSPSPLVFVAAAVIVLISLKRVVHHAASDDDARRILGRAATGVVVLFVVATVVSLTWLALVPVPDPAGPYAIVFPFPFASGEFRASP